MKQMNQKDKVISILLAEDGYLEKKSNNTLKVGLLSDFENFKIQKGEEIEPNALYEILTIKNQEPLYILWLLIFLEFFANPFMK